MGTAAQWKVWATTTPHTIDLSDTAKPPTSPEEAALAACLWDLDVDGGSWFGGGVATLGVESPTGERWACAATMVDGPQRVVLTPMVRA